MYIMLMSRYLKKTERETYYITAIQHAYYVYVSFFKNRIAKHIITAIEYVYYAYQSRSLKEVERETYYITAI